jgi:hypothetical protein
MWQSDGGVRSAASRQSSERLEGARRRGLDVATWRRAVSTSLIALALACGEDWSHSYAGPDASIPDPFVPGGEGGNDSASPPEPVGTDPDAGIDPPLPAGGRAGSGSTRDAGAAPTAGIDPIAPAFLEPLASDLRYPMHVAVRDGIAWVPESQFDAWLLDTASVQMPFVVVGIPLDGAASAPRSTISIDRDGFYPAGIAVDATGTLFIASAGTAGVLQVPPGSLEAIDFLPPGILRAGGQGMAYDEARGMLWVCDSNPHEIVAWVVGVAIADGRELVRHLLPDPGSGAQCSDVAVAPDGTVWAADPLGGRLLRLTAPDLAGASGMREWLASPALAAAPQSASGLEPGVTGLAFAGDLLFVVSSSLGALFAIDPALEAPGADALIRTRLVEPGAFGRVTLAQPSGVRALDDHQLLLLETGLGRERGRRLVRVRSSSR